MGIIRTSIEMENIMKIETDESIKKFLPDNSFRDLLADEYPDVNLLFMTEECYDAAIVGVTTSCCGTKNEYQVVYDYEIVIQVNIDQGMSELEAIEYFEANQGGAYVGEQTPIFINRIGE